MLQKDLQNALRQIDELKARNRDLETKLLLAGARKRHTVSAKQKFKKCIVFSDSMLRKFGAECFQGTENVELYRVMDKMGLSSPETFIVHVCTNDLRTTRNVDMVMGEVNALVGRLSL
jgi:hypothetical protein